MTMVATSPSRLTKLQLADLFESIQEYLFMDEHNDEWDPDREVNGGDLVEYLLERFEEYDLVPYESEVSVEDEN